MSISLAPHRNPTLEALLGLCEKGFGASTGYMEDERGNWSHLISSAESVSHQAIELSALSGGELPDLIAFLNKGPFLDFSYVSVHGPAKEWARSNGNLADVLSESLPGFVDAVVLHPESLEDLGSFSVLGPLLILENMDRHKRSARNVDELRPYFEKLPESGFCFDIAHAQMNDPSMRLAHDLLDAFGDRLRQVHLSSITEDGRHIPVTESDVQAFWPVLERCREVPWVLEAALPEH
jgi:hypothetical protein